MSFLNYTIAMLISIAEHATAAAKQLGKSLELPESVVHLTRVALDELREKVANCNATAARRQDTLDVALKEADAQAIALIENVRKVFRFKVSQKWTAMWMEAGFPKNSTRTPAKLELREVLLGDLKKFFTHHPELEDSELGVTAKLLGEAASALHTAISALAQNDAKQKQLTGECDALATTLRRRLRNLVNELKSTLADDDPRWAQLGLDCPANERERAANRRRNAAQATFAQQTEKARRQANRALTQSEKARWKAESAGTALEKAKMKAERALAQLDLAKARHENATAAAAKAAQEHKDASAQALTLAQITESSATTERGADPKGETISFTRSAA